MEVMEKFSRILFDIEKNEEKSRKTGNVHKYSTDIRVF
jgi:hypothetical protein